jgi:hypothetical protein
MPSDVRELASGTLTSSSPGRLRRTVVRGPSAPCSGRKLIQFATDGESYIAPNTYTPRHVAD